MYYKIQLLNKIEAVIKRMRWKVIFFKRKNDDNDNNIKRENYGLKSNKTPPSVNEMKDFENDLIDLINNLKFRQGKNYFQSKLNRHKNDQ